MNSFRKQLSLWGFKRLTTGLDNGAYYHQSFLRGLPHLSMNMSRQKVKGIGKARIPNPDGEPVFYRTDGFYKKLPEAGRNTNSPPILEIMSPVPKTESPAFSSAYVYYSPPDTPFGLAAAYQSEFGYGQSSSQITHSFHNDLTPTTRYSKTAIPVSLMIGPSVTSFNGSYVTEEEEEDASVSDFSADEINSIYSQMYFPPPFTPPPFVQSSTYARSPNETYSESTQSFSFVPSSTNIRVPNKKYSISSSVIGHSAVKGRLSV